VGWPGRKMGGPKRNSAHFDLLKNFSIGLELIRFKDDLPVLETFQIKYGIVENEIRNNFSYWNFSKFGLEFELKIRKGPRYLNSNEI
jgi:hypothetical protein